MTCKVYADIDYQKYIKSVKIATRNCIKMVCYQNAYVGRCGAFDSKYRQLVKIKKRFTPPIGRKWLFKRVKFINSDAVYLGRTHWHFGHFLTECTDRMWAVGERQFDKYVFVHNNNSDVTPEFIFAFMELFGISRDKILIVKSPIQFKNLYVPDPAFSPSFTSDKFSQTFDRICKNVKQGKYSHVYVSRTAMGARSVFGEKQIEQMFAKNGFHVIYPEQLPLTKQVQIISGATVLAGCAGTALHLALFMSRGGTVIQIKRNKKIKDNAPTQLLINKTRKLNSVFVSASIENVPTQHYTHEPQIIGMTDYMKKFMSDNNFTTGRVKSDFELAQYNAAFADYVKQTGGRMSQHARHKFANILCSFVPVSGSRRKLHNYLKRKLNF